MPNLNSSPLDGLKKNARVAYLAHRLNQPELIEVANKIKAFEKGQASNDEVKGLIDKYSEISTDWRGTHEASDLARATKYLKLDAQFAALDQDKAWTPSQRALYRRISAPQNDPAPPSKDRIDHGIADFADSATALFDRADENHDGQLSPVELDHTMADPQYVGKDAATLAVLRRSGPQLATCATEPSADGVTRADLQAFILHGVPNDSTATIKINERFADMITRAEHLPPTVPLEQENFDPQGVFQSKAGSCVMLSTEAGASASAVREMFHDNHDGTITVHFKDGAQETVKDLTTAERIYHARTGQEGRWPGLMEMAMGQRLFKTNPKEDGSVRSSVNGQPVEVTIAAFSGFPGKKYSIDDLSPNQTRELLTKLAQDPGPLVCATRSAPHGDDQKFSVEQLHNGIANNHAYQLQGYDPVSDQVQLRNPWHRGEWTIHGDGVEDGKFSLPLLDFYSSYRWVAGPDRSASSSPANPRA